jgi:hypothetical protein
MSDLFLFPEEGGNVCLRNMRKDLPNYASPHKQVATVTASGPTSGNTTSKHKLVAKVTGALVICMLGNRRGGYNILLSYYEMRWKRPRNQAVE